MGAHLHDAAVFYHHDPVRILQSAKAMGDGYGGPVGHQIVNGFWINFSVSVSTAEVASSRIKIAGFQYGPGDGDPLLLTSESPYPVRLRQYRRRR